MSLQITMIFTREREHSFSSPVCLLAWKHILHFHYLFAWIHCSIVPCHCSISFAWIHIHIHIPCESLREALSLCIDGGSRSCIGRGTPD